MKNLSNHAWIIWGIALITTLALMILIPFTRNVTWWIAAGGTVLMFGLCALTFRRAFRRNVSLESKVLGWPIFQVGYTALTVQLVVGFAVMGLASLCPAWAAVLAEIVVFAVTGVCLTVKDAFREVVRQTEVSVTDRTGEWKTIRARAASIAAATSHPDLKKIAEEIRYADPTPTSMDGQIAQMLETLSSYADAENIRKAFELLRQRKAISKEEK